MTFGWRLTTYCSWRHTWSILLGFIPNPPFLRSLRLGLPLASLPTSSPPSLTTLACPPPALFTSCPAPSPHTEPEAVDLLLEVDQLEQLEAYVDDNNFARTCLYLTSCCTYLPEPEDTQVNILCVCVGGGGAASNVGKLLCPCRAPLVHMEACRGDEESAHPCLYLTSCCTYLPEPEDRVLMICRPWGPGYLAGSVSRTRIIACVCGAGWPDVSVGVVLMLPARTSATSCHHGCKIGTS